MALALANSCGGAEPQRTVRLFDSVEQLSVEPPSLQLPDPGRFSYGLDSREALAVPAGTSLSVQTQVGPGARLAFGFGLTDTNERHEEEVEVKVEISGPGLHPGTLFSVTLPHRQAEYWRDEQVDLGEFALRPISLTFRTVVGAQSAATAVWANPRVVYPRMAGERNLILISIDTLRADHVNAYGYRKRTTTPNIDQIARDGVRFENFFANAPWTTPSHMSLFTSLYPSAHGLNQPIRLMREKMLSVNPAVVTLAQVLRSSGFSTAAFVSAGAISGKYGFWNGFELFDETVRKDNSDVDRVCSKAGRWLAKNKDQRFFLFLHTYEVHAPSTHTEFLNEAAHQDWSPAERARAAYDADLRYADEVLGEFFSELKRLGLYESSLIVVLSDHGENLHDRMVDLRPVGHGFNLRDEMLRVPLIIAAPGKLPPSTTIGNLVESVDVMPTLIELLGVHDKPSVMQGRDLSPLIHGGGYWQSDRPVFAEATSYGPERKAVRNTGYKLVLVPSLEPSPYRQLPGGTVWDWSKLDQRALFDLSSDPFELDNAIASQRREAYRLEKIVVAIAEANRSLHSRLQPESAEPDPELLERLRSLGYIQ